MMNALIDLLKSLTGWHWLGLAAVLMIVELIGFAGFLFWLGLSATLVGIILFVLPNLSWPYQFILFAIGSIISCIVWRHYLKHTDRDNHSTLNKRSEQYIGRIFTLQEPIINGRGRVHVDDSQWRVEGDDLPIGAQIKVIGVDGVILKVQASNKSKPEAP